MSNTARMGILVGGGPAPGINSAIGAAVWEWVRWQWHRSRRPGQAEPPGIIASLLRKARRDRLPPKILSVVFIVIVPAYCLRVNFVLV